MSITVFGYGRAPLATSLGYESLGVEVQGEPIEIAKMFQANIQEIALCKSMGDSVFHLLRKRELLAQEVVSSTDDPLFARLNETYMIRLVAPGEKYGLSAINKHDYPIVIFYLANSKGRGFSKPYGYQVSCYAVDTIMNSDGGIMLDVHHPSVTDDEMARIKQWLLSLGRDDVTLEGFEQC